MSKQAITLGFPAPNYICDTGAKDSILPGTYVVQTGISGAPGFFFHSPWGAVTPPMTLPRPLYLAVAYLAGCLVANSKQSRREFLSIFGWRGEK